MRLNWADPYESREPRILGIDIENGTRWGWGPGGYTKSVVYGVSWKWVGTPDEDVQSILIDWRADDKTLRRLCAGLWGDASEADAYLGHNFPHDFSGLQGLARDIGLPFLRKVRTIDTLKDIPRHQGPSKSLEALCQQYGLGPKPHLSEYDWTMAFIRWRPEYLEMVRNRNEQDVILTERLYLKEKELGWL